MEEYTQPEKSFLLKLARKTIEQFFNSKEKLKITDAEVPFDKLKEKRAVFITLTQEDNLRGCIGCLEAERPLYQEVIDKALCAAFQDPRFFPLSREELPNIKICISILTVPKSLAYKDYNDLLQKLTPNKDGVILKKGFASATYLPKVWEELPEKGLFLSSLCEKAGLESNAWQYPLEVATYQTVDFSE